MSALPGLCDLRLVLDCPKSKKDGGTRDGGFREIAAKPVLDRTATQILQTSDDQCQQGIEMVGLGCRFVPADAMNAGKPHGNAGLVSG